MTKSHRQYFNELAPDWEAKMPVQAEFSDYIRRFDVMDGDRVLDIGAGTGRMSRLLLDAVGPEGRVIAQDIAVHMLIEARSLIPKLDSVCEDVNALSYPDATFDKVLCFSAFPHFTDQILALKEMARVLKRGGQILILHNRSSQDLNTFHNSLGDPVKQDRLPRASVLSKMMTQTGLDIIRVEETKNIYWVESFKP